MALCYTGNINSTFFHLYHFKLSRLSVKYDYILFPVVPITTLMRRKPVDVAIDYLPSDHSVRKAKFLRQTSLPASQLISRLLPAEVSSKRLNRLNSSPDHANLMSEGIASLIRHLYKRYINLYNCFKTEL